MRSIIILNNKTVKNIIISLFIIFFTGNIYAQKVDIDAWKKQLLTKEDTEKINIDNAKYWDLSSIISNRPIEEHIPFSSYVGAFGPKYRRIDFNLVAHKSKTSDYVYDITGKSRLGNNIRRFDGTMRLTNLNYTTYPSKMYFAIFNYHLNEPGDKDGDGIFEGIFSLVFFFKNGKLELYWSECGEFRDWNNVFVGTWKKYNSDVKQKCILSYSPVGLDAELPFCEDLYTYDEEIDDMTYISGKYLKYGWEGFDTFNKTKWW